MSRFAVVSLVPLLASLASLAALAPPAAAQDGWRAASLDGSQEVPAVATSARGWAVVSVDTTTLKVNVFVHTTGVVGTMAHLHEAPPGVNGPVILPLAGGPSVWQGSATLTLSQVLNIFNDGTYVNVHSAAHPGGEIRGLVTTSVASRFDVMLDGAQAVPPTTSSGVGIGTAFLHEPDNVLTYNVQVKGVATITAAHLRQGMPGQNGAVISALHGAGTTYCGVTKRLSAAQLAALKAGNTYLNVETTTFPSGEIRGQVVPRTADWFGRLDGAQEVPPVTTNAFGQACLLLNPDNSLSYVVRTGGLVGTMAHIHRAAVGVNGPVIFPLSGGPTVYAGTTPPLTAAQLADLQNGLYYVNVHTAANAGGEIRSQLRMAALPHLHGGGCPTGSGSIPEIGSDRAVCVGANYEVTLHGGPPNEPAVLLIGFSRTNFHGLPLPLNLAVINAPGCYLLIDDLVLLHTTTDGLGCADRPLGVPFDISLRDAIHYAQWVMLDRSKPNPLGVVTSNALCLIIH